MAQAQRDERTYAPKGLAVPGAEVALRDALFEARGKFLEVNGGDLAPFQREYENAMQIFRRQDYVCDVARKNPASLRDALIQSALCGISLDVVKGHAYLVPRGGAIYFDPSYRGLRDAAVEDRIIKWAESEIVHEHDQFEIVTREDGGRDVNHNFNPFGARGAIVGAYCHWEDFEGRRNLVFETIEEIYRSHRSRSESWKKSESGIWATDENEAIRKSLIKRAHKSWPRPLGLGGRFDLAVAASIHAEGENALHDISEVITEARASQLSERARPNVEKWCQFYKVESLNRLTPSQADDMTRRLDSAAKRQSDEAARTERKETKQQSQAAKPAAAGDQKPAAGPKPAEQPAADENSIDVDALWAEIDNALMQMSDGKDEEASKTARQVRKSLGFGETQDLTPAEVQKFRDAVVKMAE